MSQKRIGTALMLAVGLGVLGSCVGESQATADAAGSRASGDSPVVKGGDNRTGMYNSAPADWWPDAPEHDDVWTWGQASGVVADGPDRILVGLTGDRRRDGTGSALARNLIVAVNSQGELIENWTQWDTVVGFPHQLYISPYDPERHIWVVDRGGGPHNIHEQILKFTNDGSELVLRLLDPQPRQSEAEARANPNPGPLDFGQAAVLAFMPNGDFLVGDGYQNGRIIRYDADGNFLSEFGSVGTGPGQFDLVHGVAVDRNHRIYVSDRDNDRIQVFTEDGEFIEEWPDLKGPTGIYIDERENVWVLSTTLNQILEFNLDGVLQYQFGAYCCTRGGFVGGFSRPHQMAVDPQGNLYVTQYDGGYITRYLPKPGADPDRIVGQPLVLPN